MEGVCVHVYVYMYGMCPIINQFINEIVVIRYSLFSQLHRLLDALLCSLLTLYQNKLCSVVVVIGSLNPHPPILSCCCSTNEMERVQTVALKAL